MQTKLEGDRVLRANVPSVAAERHLTDSIALADPVGMTCTNGWDVTGYYTPLESDFNGTSRQINIVGRGSDQFPSDFIKAMNIEGWGQTRYGWFLGYDGKIYTSSSAPLNGLDQPLKIGSLAVDKSEIAYGKSVRITNLLPPWSNQVFVADDVGAAIKKRHVDVYCGIGRAARAETFRITSSGRRLCQS